MASDDDVYEPEFLEEIDKLVQKYPNVDLFRARMQRINESGELLLRESKWEEFMDHPHFFYASRPSGMFTCEANYVYKTSALKKRGGYKDFPLAIYTDKATHILLAENGCANTIDILFSYRASKDSVCGRPATNRDAIMKIEASMSFWNWMANYIDNIKDTDEKEMKEKVLTGYYTNLTHAIRTFSPHLPWSYFRKWTVPFSKTFGMSKSELTYQWLKNKINF